MAGDDGFSLWVAVIIVDGVVVVQCCDVVWYGVVWCSGACDVRCMCWWRKRASTSRDKDGERRKDGEERSVGRYAVYVVISGVGQGRASEGGQESLVVLLCMCVGIDEWMVDGGCLV